MKNRFFAFVPMLILFGILKSFSQGINFIENSDGYEQYFLVGTLGHTSTSVKEKLKVEVFGGNWHNSNLGEDIYYISTRDGIKINRERHGGQTSRFALEVFDNGSSYDFVIHTTTAFPAIQIKSWYLNGSYGINTNTEFQIVAYDPTGKSDITSQVTIVDVFYADNNGNIGIGTMNTTEKLNVKGTIQATEVKVQNVPNSDYVFESDYQLRPINEVETFIKENQHLPDIPSAEEFKENGVGLGEMDNMLLRKVEEIMLYVIELKKENEELNSKNEALLNRIEKLETK